MNNTIVTDTINATIDTMSNNSMSMNRMNPVHIPNSTEPTLDFQNLGFYGRNDELLELSKAFETVVQVSNNNSCSNPVGEQEVASYNSFHHVQVTLVHGFSGTGKSMLIQKFKEYASEKCPDCCFLLGKFEQNLESVPFSALVSAFSQLCEYILKSRNSKAIINELKKGMRAEHRIILANAIERFWKVFDDLPKNKRRPSFYDNSAFLRTQYIFRDCVRILSGLFPIVLVLEDLHWSNSSSLELLRTIISDQYSTFFFIGSYRTNQVDESHPLSFFIRSLTHTTVYTREIYLQSFSHEIVHTIVSDLTMQHPEECRPLTDLVYTKTRGNIFFLLHYLHMLQKRGWLVWSPDEQKLKCLDMAWIRQETSMPDDVALIVAEEIQQLSPRTQYMLKIASCLGAQFCVVMMTCIMTYFDEVDVDDYLTLDATVYAPTDEQTNSTLAMLQEATILGLVMKYSDSLYAFEHDRVQQAAYMLIPEGSDKLEMHFKIGKILYQYSLGFGTDHSENLPLLAVTQLNQGSALIMDTRVKVQLAQMNMDAANSVMVKSGFTTAIEYLQQGIDLLKPKERWLEHYDLALQLSSSLAEISYTCRDFVRCKHNVDDVVQNGRCFQDKFAVYYTLIQSLYSQHRIDEAIDVGLQVLDVLGEKLIPSTLRFVSSLRKFRAMINNHSIEEICNCPVLVLKEKLQANKVLRSLTMLTWFSNRADLLVHLQMRLVHITLKYGASSHSSFGFASLGMIFGANGNYSEAYRAGVVASKMAQTFHPQGCDAMTSSLIHTMLNHWQRPYKESIAPLLRAHQSAVASGDIEGTVLTANFYIIALRVSGENLDKINADTQHFAELMHDYDATHVSVRFMLLLLKPLWQWNLNLAGEAKNPLKLTGKAMNEEDFAADCLDANNVRAMEAVYTAKMNLGYYFGDIKVAYEASQSLEKIDHSKTCPSLNWSSRFLFCGLIDFEMYRQTKNKKHLQNAIKCISKLQKWQKSGNPNVEHAILMLKAEMVSLGSNVKERKAAFDTAINSCRRAECPQNEALANQRAAVFCLQDGDTPSACEYMVNAKLLYSKWGAIALAEYIKSKYSYLFYDHHTSESSDARTKTRRKNVKRSTTAAAH